MKTTIPERITIIKNELGITADTEFGRLCGMSKAVVGQLKTGLVKTFAARYAYKLEATTGFCGKWIQTGEGAMRLDRNIERVIKIMEKMSDADRRDVVDIVELRAKP